MEPCCEDAWFDVADAVTHAAQRFPQAESVGRTVCKRLAQAEDSAPLLKIICTERPLQEAHSVRVSR
jgi:hypothetical protein